MLISCTRFLLELPVLRLEPGAGSRIYYLEGYVLHRSLPVSGKSHMDQETGLYAAEECLGQDWRPLEISEYRENVPDVFGTFDQAESTGPRDTRARADRLLQQGPKTHVHIAIMKGHTSEGNRQFFIGKQTRQSCCTPNG